MSTPDSGQPAPRVKPVRYARKEYWNEPTMTLWERAYLPEVLRGLAITTGVFLRNMGKWITGRRGAVTTYYPEERRADFAPRNRGKHVLTQRPDGSVQCIACNMCATVCPAKVIEIEPGFDMNDPAHPKYPVRFEIDYSRCVFCGMCVEACPEDAIRMEPDVPNLVSDDRYNMWITMDEMMTWRPQSDVAKPYPPKPVALTRGSRPEECPIETLILAVFGLLALVSAASMLVLKEPMRVALALITSMMSLGAIYGLLGVHFIAAFQVLIYVGAVMVFMVYVIMLLQVRESPNNPRYSSLLVPGLVAGALLLAALAIGMSRPGVPQAELPASSQSFGLTEFSTAFLREYWLAFELTSVFLVAAIVAALAVIGVSRRAGGSARG